MITATFKPVWLPFSLSDITEGDGVNVAAPAQVQSVLTVPAGITEIAVDSGDEALVSSVERDGEVISYHLSNGVMTIPARSTSSIVIIHAAAEMTYSVFGGNLPPGLALLSGRLRGIVGNIPSKAAVEYRFGLRCHFRDFSADAIKTWVAFPADETLLWNYASLPDPTDKLIPGQQCYSFGDFKRGQSLSYDIDIFNPDATPLPVLVRSPVGVPNAPSTFIGLPTGVEILSNPCRIVGFIPAEAAPGDYYVELWVDEPFPLPPIVIHFKVLTNSFDQFTAVNRLTWKTESNLGLFAEGQLCSMRVLAANSSGEPVVYSIAAGSRALPIGLTLASNGEVQGTFGHVPSRTSFEFSVKATSGRFVSTRTFTFQVDNRLVSGKFATISLPLAGKVKADWLDNASHLTDLYRPTDKNFATSTSIDVLRGIRAGSLKSLPYAQPTHILLGPYSSATVTANGQPLYDVIFRSVIDPREKSGGYLTNTSEAIPSPVLYPQNASVQIVEPSLNNIRRDLVARSGLDTISNRLDQELLPLWQSLYEPILIVGYVLPGTAAKQVAKLSYGNLPVGVLINFDRLLVREGASGYYFYLGSGDQSAAPVVVGAPLPPADIRVDGVPAAQASGKYREPTFSWIAQEPDLTFVLNFRSGDTLIRTVEVTGTSFRYTSTFQSVDSRPGHVSVSITATRGDLSSLPVTCSALLHAGWGIAWGLRYGGSA